MAVDEFGELPGDLSPYRMIVVARQFGFSDVERGALAAFHEAGGFLVATSHFGVFGEGMNPSLNALTVNALCAADSVLIPLQCEFYALEGLSRLIDTIERVRGSYNPRLAIEGILFCMFDSRTNLSREVAAEVRTHFPDKVYQTVIPRNVRLGESERRDEQQRRKKRETRGIRVHFKLL